MTSQASNPATANPMDAYLQALGGGSRRTIEQSLGVAAGLLAGDPDTKPREFDWSELNAARVSQLRRDLPERYAPSTTNKILAALRGVLRVCRDQGRMSEAQFQSATRFDPVKDFRQTESRVLSEDDLAHLFIGCADEGTAAGRRDAALLAIFLATGLRRDEVIELNADDYDPAARTLHIRSDLPERDRHAAVGERACAAIDHWLEARADLPGDAPLLMPVDKGGTIRPRRLTSQAVYGIINRTAERAGLEHTTTRDLRRTCIVRLIRAGMDLDQARRQVGHASWLTTAAYQSLAEEVGKLKSSAVPYQPPPDPAEKET